MNTIYLLKSYVHSCQPSILHVFLCFLTDLAPFTISNPDRTLGCLVVSRTKMRDLSLFGKCHETMNPLIFESTCENNAFSELTEHSIKMRVRVLSSSLLTIVIATSSSRNDYGVDSLILLPPPSRRQHLVCRKNVQHGCGYGNSSVGMIRMCFGRTALGANKNSNKSTEENEPESPSFPVPREIMTSLFLLLLSQLFLFI